MFTVYIVQCADTTLYTGCTNNLVKRLAEHNTGKNGAKYTRARRPVKLVHYETFRTLKAGRRREAAIKRLTRKQKMLLYNPKKSI